MSSYFSLHYGNSCGSSEADPVGARNGTLGKLRRLLWASSEEDPVHVRMRALGKGEGSAMVHMF